MGAFFDPLVRASRLSRNGGHGSNLRPDYIRFMEQFIDAHPEILVDQNKGWRIYWGEASGLGCSRKRPKKTPFQMMAMASDTWPGIQERSQRRRMGSQMGNELLEDTDLPIQSGCLPLGAKV